MLRQDITEEIVCESKAAQLMADERQKEPERARVERTGDKYSPQGHGPVIYSLQEVPTSCFYHLPVMWSDCDLVTGIDHLMQLEPHVLVPASNAHELATKSMSLGYFRNPNHNTN